jgi:hypothetical protein
MVCSVETIGSRVLSFAESTIRTRAMHRLSRAQHGTECWFSLLTFLRGSLWTVTRLRVLKLPTAAAVPVLVVPGTAGSSAALLP